MEFPPPWSVFQAEEFELAAARDPRELGVELMAQLRPSGRIIDHMRLVLGGTTLLEVRIPFKLLIGAAEMPDWTWVFTTWPAAVKIRRNMTTGAWADLRDLLASNDGRVELGDGQGVETKDVLDWLDSLGDKTANSASFRWAVTVGDDGRLELELQGLPCPASFISNKPSFRG